MCIIKDELDFKILIFLISFIRSFYSEENFMEICFLLE